jgi:hypothetical protein
MTCQHRARIVDDRHAMSFLLDDLNMRSVEGDGMHEKRSDSAHKVSPARRWLSLEILFSLSLEELGMGDASCGGHCS